jgi:hypothetical protein
MDRKFLEFWGNALLSAAKGQEQVETLNRWASEGFRTFEQQLSFFQKFYGPDKKQDTTTDSQEMWAKAASDFMKSYQEFLGLMGMIPREDYEALSRENEALKKKAVDLEEALRRETKKTGTDETDPAEVVKGFEGLMKKQAEQFQALMGSYGKLYDAAVKKDSAAETRSPKGQTRKGRP